MAYMHRKPTMRDVAKAAGLSISTVSHVLNGTRFVSADSTARVEEAIRTLKFKANPIARSLKSGKSRLIAFVVSNIENYFCVNMARGIEKVMHSRGYQMVLIDSAEQKETEMRNIESLSMGNAEGIIMVPTKIDCGYLGDLLPPDFPLVFVDRQPSNYPADCVLLHNEEAGYEATRHLFARGYTRIGFIALHFGESAVDKTIAERIEGYKKAYREAGLELNPAYIQAIPSGSSALSELRYAESYHRMKRLLGSSIQAVLCGNSLAAIGAFTCLREMSIRIPEDLGFITFDDDLWLSMTTPRITAIVQPAESMGTVAAQRLLKRIQGEPLVHGSFRLKAEIIFRESC
jgi:LacI family transcriptional regulator